MLPGIEQHLSSGISFHSYITMTSQSRDQNREPRYTNLNVYRSSLAKRRGSNLLTAPAGLLMTVAVKRAQRATVLQHVVQPFSRSACSPKTQSDAQNADWK